MSLPPARILIVDDEAPFRDMVAAALSRYGHAVEAVSNGRQAITRFGKGTFDLIITDVIMPEADGLELMMDLRAANKEVVVIAMTGTHSFTELYLKTATALGACRVLTKPFKIAQLVETVRDALAAPTVHGVS